MQEGPVRAQERFHELDATLYRVGFKPRAEQPGSQAWTARLMWKSPILLLSFIFVWVAALFWIWRKVMKHRIEVTFEPDASGTKVTLTGRAGGSIGPKTWRTGTGCPPRRQTPTRNGKTRLTRRRWIGSRGGP